MATKAMSNTRCANKLIGYATTVMLVIAGVFGVMGSAQAYSPPSREIIPDSAFLRESDVHSSSMSRPDSDMWPYLRPAKPCGVDRYQLSTFQQVVDAALLIDYPTDDFHTTLIEHVGLYRSGGAARYVDEVRRTLTENNGCGDSAGRWTLLRAGIAGPNSMLISLRQQIEDYGGNLVTKTSYLAVAQVNRVLVVLSDVGWETGSGDPGNVLNLIDIALRRAAAALLKSSY